MQYYRSNIYYLYIVNIGGIVGYNSGRGRCATTLFSPSLLPLFSLYSPSNIRLSPPTNNNKLLNNYSIVYNKYLNYFRCFLDFLAFLCFLFLFFLDLLCFPPINIHEPSEPSCILPFSQSSYAINRSASR